MKRCAPRLVLAAVFALAGCAKHASHTDPAAPSVVVAVPRAPVPPQPHQELLDGHEWAVSFHGPPFLDASGFPRPHTHLQFMADEKNLYVGYYAADQDLRTVPRPGDSRGALGDRFTLHVGSLEVVLNPKGAVQVPPGVEVTTRVDGSVDRSSNDDEEWVAEIVIPWSQLGPGARQEGLRFRALRTDAPKRAPERALAWPRQGFGLLTFDSLRAG
jgi:hypothetical protein